MESAPGFHRVAVSELDQLVLREGGGEGRVDGVGKIVVEASFRGKAEAYDAFRHQLDAEQDAIIGQKLERPGLGMAGFADAAREEVRRELRGAVLLHVVAGEFVGSHG